MRYIGVLPKYVKPWQNKKGQTLVGIFQKWISFIEFETPACSKNASLEHYNKILSFLVFLVESMFFDWRKRCPNWFWWMQCFLSNFVYMRVWLIDFEITHRKADRPEPQVLSWTLKIDRKIHSLTFQPLVLINYSNF